MVALTIIVSAVTSSLALVQSSLTSTRISGSQVIAANLAREGIEVVRSIRDSNWLMGRSFKIDLISGAVKSARPMLDTVNGTWSMDIGTVDINDDAARLYILSNGVYVHANVQPTGSSVTQYRRVVAMNHICRKMSGSADERIVAGAGTCDGTEELVGLSVDSQVSYVGQSAKHRNVIVQERFYDWR